MATYVLIHGSFQGAWIWQPTVALLHKAGHAVYAPTQDGCAERKSGLRPGITVTSAAQELADLMFYEDLKDVIVVGTSTGGLIAQKLAVLGGDRVGRLVFLDALAPLPGERIRDIVNRPNAPPYQMTELTRFPMPEDLANGLYRRMPPAEKAWALPRATPHPLGLSDAAPGELDDFWSRSWKASVIRCAESPNPPEAHQRRTAEKLKAPYSELQSGHYAMLTHPEMTAAALQG
jgi:pimeloyl-ACP methyl ester carboxylesterase